MKCSLPRSPHDGDAKGLPGMGRKKHGSGAVRGSFRQGGWALARRGVSACAGVKGVDYFLCAASQAGGVLRSCGGVGAEGGGGARRESKYVSILMGHNV